MSRRSKRWIRVFVLFLAVGMVMGLGNMTAKAAGNTPSVQIPVDEITPEMVQGVNYLVSRFPSLKQLFSASAEGDKLALNAKPETVEAVQPELASGSLLGIPVQDIPATVVSALSGSELGRTLLGQISGLISSGEISVG